MKSYFQKILLFISIVLFLALGFTFFSLYKIVNNNNQKAESNMAAWQTELNRRSDIAALNNSLEQVSNDRSALASHFAQSSDVVPFLNTVERLAGEADASAVLDGVDTGTNNNHLVVELKATGSFTSIYKFLTLLENSPYELDFLSIDVHKDSLVTAPTKGSQNTDWEAVFRIQLLSFTP